MSVRILLADDHPIVRQGMRNLLDSEDGFTVVGEAENGLEAVQMAEKLKPTVVVADMMMPHLTGTEAILQIKKKNPDIYCIILSMQSARPYIFNALKAGASGYILKDSGPAELVGAIRQVLSGKRYLSPKISEEIIDIFINQGGTDTLDPYNSLTSREREILHLVAEGHSNAEIAELLWISARTVEQHRKTMIEKMGFDTTVDLIRFALKRVILNVDE